MLQMSKGGLSLSFFKGIFGISEIFLPSSAKSMEKFGKPKNHLGHGQGKPAPGHLQRVIIRLIQMCDMINSYVLHDSFKCVTCLIHMCDMTHSFMAI